ncbi:hypothetical protein LWI28_002872 [Acer negundo]|uniref:Uncharacterized protein n=1 Tax=Acer negundo TaxID=4023 RepID=A0AAD5NQK0_ACENE|nr:hypothetical protein LWI28_002872 [Acer negundo]
MEGGKAVLEEQLATVVVALVAVEREVVSKDQVVHELREELEGKYNALACDMVELELGDVDRFKRSPACGKILNSILLIKKQVCYVMRATVHSLEKRSRPYLFDEEKMIKARLFPQITAARRCHEFLF